MEIISTFPRLRGATLEGISANLYGGSTKNCKAARRTGSVTANGAGLIWPRARPDIPISGRARWANVQPFSLLVASL
jgi:hypothetical protein